MTQDDGTLKRISQEIDSYKGIFLIVGIVLGFMYFSIKQAYDFGKDSAAILITQLRERLEEQITQNGKLEIQRLQQEADTNNRKTQTEATLRQKETEFNQRISSTARELEIAKANTAELNEKLHVEEKRISILNDQNSALINKMKNIEDNSAKIRRELEKSEEVRLNIEGRILAKIDIRSNDISSYLGIIKNSDPSESAFRMFNTGNIDISRSYVCANDSVVNGIKLNYKLKSDEKFDIVTVNGEEFYATESEMMNNYNGCYTNIVMKRAKPGCALVDVICKRQ